MGCEREEEERWTNMRGEENMRRERDEEGRRGRGAKEYTKG